MRSLYPSRSVFDVPVLPSLISLSCWIRCIAQLKEKNKGRGGFCTFPRILPFFATVRSTVGGSRGRTKPWFPARMEAFV